jgi:hypothetical protein
MNRFLTKRRAKREPPPKPKFELDIANALPPTDDFRTSLIMGSLSARFSMLREQDDPLSLLGKASDDSVLHPRRQSRLMDYGFLPGRMGLDDIAEVASIRETASIRPPFAEEDRAHSYMSDGGYGTDDDSLGGGVMNRSRPGEGNVLFGGRQKVYKIPLASESALSQPSGLKGRTLYEDDVSMSTFQKWRREERDRMGRTELNPADAAAEQYSPEKPVPLSPALPGSITRQTSSSTSTSAPYNGRGSTAATSIASQSSSLPLSTPATTASYASSSGSPAFERTAAAKAKRLYDSGLHRDIEDQQSNTMSRLNSLAKGGRGRVSPPFARAPSRNGSTEPTRAPSPTRSSPTSYPAGPFSAESPAADSGSASPLDTFTSPLGSALNPNDRGKATALGAFNKPQAFNERQYLERQLTLRNDRSASSTRLDSSIKEEPRPSVDLEHSETPSQTNSIYSTRSRAPTVSSIQQEAPSAFSVFHNAASHLRKGPTLAPEPEEPELEEPNTFFHNRSSNGSSYDTDPSMPPPSTTVKPLGHSASTRIPQIASFAQPPNHEHPAFKSRVSQTDPDIPKPRPLNFSTPFNRSSNASDSNSIRKKTASVVSVEPDTNNSLGLANGGLNGLVFTHLRQNSGSSSIYADTADQSSIQSPMQSPVHAPFQAPFVPQFPVPLQVPVQVPVSAPAPLAPTKLAVRTREPSPIRRKPVEDYASAASAAPNPFDLEHVRTGRDSPVSPVEPAEPATTSPKGVKSDRRRGISIIPGSEIAWQQDLKKSHIRGPSAETIQEQDALSLELAKRQKAIQDRLKAARVDSDSSPSPSDERQGFGPFRGLELLKNKGSKESMRREPQAQGIGSSKPGKILGLSSTERPSFQSDRWTRDREEPIYTSVRSRSASRTTTSRAASQRYQPVVSDSAYAHDRVSIDERPVTRDRKNSTPPISAFNSARSRSNSSQSQSTPRSRSRTGKSKDEDRASGRGDSQSYPDRSIPENVHGSAKSSFEQPSGPGLSIQTGRIPNSSFEPKGLFPPPPPVLSPISASSTSSSPLLPIQGTSLLSPRQSPDGFSPITAHRSPFPADVATPPLSETSTPVMASTPTFPQHAPQFGAAAMRAKSHSQKRPIQKSDISDPVLISTTSVIDTIALPAGASLRNGMDEVSSYKAPPLPPLNPMRRKFGFGKGAPYSNGASPVASHAGLDDFLNQRNSASKHSGTYGRSVSSSGSAGSGGSAAATESLDRVYPLSSDEAPVWRPKHGLRKSSSEGEKLGMRLRAQQELQRQMQMELTSGLRSGFGQSETPTNGAGGPAVEGGMF